MHQNAPNCAIFQRKVSNTFASIPKKLHVHSNFTTVENVHLSPLNLA